MQSLYNSNGNSISLESLKTCDNQNRNDKAQRLQGKKRIVSVGRAAVSAKFQVFYILCEKLILMEYHLYDMKKLSTGCESHEMFNSLHYLYSKLHGETHTQLLLY